MIEQSDAPNHDLDVDAVESLSQAGIFSGSSAVDAIPLTIRVVIGSTAMSVREVSQLQPGKLLTLDRELGQPVEIMINDRIICRGEIGLSEGDAPRFVVKIVELGAR